MQREARAFFLLAAAAHVTTTGEYSRYNVGWNGTSPLTRNGGSDRPGDKKVFGTTVVCAREGDPSPSPMPCSLRTRRSSTTFSRSGWTASAAEPAPQTRSSTLARVRKAATAAAMLAVLPVTRRSGRKRDD